MELSQCCAAYRLPRTVPLNKGCIPSQVGVAHNRPDHVELFSDGRMFERCFIQ